MKKIKIKKKSVLKKSTSNKNIERFIMQKTEQLIQNRFKSLEAELAKFVLNQSERYQKKAFKELVDSTIHNKKTKSPASFQDSLENSFVDLFDEGKNFLLKKFL